MLDVLCVALGNKLLHVGRLQLPLPPLALGKRDRVLLGRELEVRPLHIITPVVVRMRQMAEDWEGQAGRREEQEEGNQYWSGGV